MKLCTYCNTVATMLVVSIHVLLAAKSTKTSETALQRECSCDGAQITDLPGYTWISHLTYPIADTSTNAEPQPFIATNPCGIRFAHVLAPIANGEGMGYMMASKSVALRELGYKRSDIQDILLSQTGIILEVSPSVIAHVQS